MPFLITENKNFFLSTIKKDFLPFISLENTAIYEYIFCETRIQAYYVGISSGVSTLKLTS